jgi:hypothetical protein
MLTVMPLVCTKHPEKSSGLAMWSSGPWGDAVGEIPARCSRQRGSGKGRSGPRGSRTTDLWPELGSGRHR